VKLDGTIFSPWINCLIVERSGQLPFLGSSFGLVIGGATFLGAVGIVAVAAWAAVAISWIS
jgi:hypothetical protein